MKFSFFSTRQKFNYGNVNFGVDPLPPLLEKVQILNFFGKASLSENSALLLKRIELEIAVKIITAWKQILQISIDQIDILQRCKNCTDMLNFHLVHAKSKMIMKSERGRPHWKQIFPDMLHHFVYSSFNKIWDMWHMVGWGEVNY